MIWRMPVAQEGMGKADLALPVAGVVWKVSAKDNLTIAWHAAVAAATQGRG